MGDRNVSDDVAESGAGRSFAFGPFVLVPGQQLLLEFGTPVRIGGRAFDILTVLVSCAGEVVTKNDLLARVWPTTVVEDGNLKVNMATLRRILGEVPDAPRYIATVVGRGYRFIAPVQAVASSGPVSATGPTSPVGYRLPSAATRIVGRADAIQAVCRALEASRLVSLVGPGGIGKTTVAMAVAQQVEDAGDTAVTFVDLARVASDEFVATSLAAALGVHAGGVDSLQAVVAILAGRDALLVLDTCEHVLGAACRVCEVLLATATNVRILTTTRQVLHLHGEHVEWLEPLEVPPFDDQANASDVLRFTAPQLLAQRVFEKTGYRILDSDAPAVAEICRRLDGAPLSIELVSSRFAGRSAAAVLDELDDRFRTLRRDLPGGPLRQQTLLATLEWSYALLTTNEAALLRALSIFAGSFDMDSAVAAVAHTGLSLVDTYDAVSQLHAKTMIGLDQTSGHLRYRLLDTTRTFAGSLLEDQGELAAVSASHARLQLEILQHAGANRSAMPAGKWQATYGGLADDLRKAVDWALYRGGDPLLGIRLVAAGLPLWQELSLGEESRRNCEKAVAELGRIGLADSRLELKLIMGLGSAHNTGLAANADKAIGLLQTAIGLARDAGDARAECRVLSALVTYQLLPGYERAVPETLEAMRQAALRAQDRSAVWEQELRVAEWKSLNCDIPDAIVQLKRLRAEMRDASLDSAKGFFIAYQRTKLDVHLAALLWLTGRPGEAISLAEEAARAAMEIPHGSTLAYCLVHGIIWTMNESHYYTRARYYAELLKVTIYRHGMADWIPIANCYGEAITALSGAGSDPAALLAAFNDLRKGMFHLGHHSYFATLIKAMIATGQMEDATLAVALVFEQGVQRWMLPEFLRLRAATERAAGRDGDAKATLIEALGVADEIACLSWKLRSALDLARLLKDQGRNAEARKILAPVYARFSDGFDTGDLRQSRELLARLGP